MNDTTPEIARIVREKIMALSGNERLRIGSRMFEVSRTMVLASFPRDLPEIEVKRRLCVRLYGNAVDAEAFVQSLIITG